MDDIYRELLAQIEQRKAILFLGAGSSASCKGRDGQNGLTGHGLAREIIGQLLRPGAAFPFQDHHVPTLMEAAEYYQSNHPGRRTSLDDFIQQRLRGLQPTLAHYLATCFHWKAVVTTNYNTVAEDAWSEAVNKGFAADEVLVIRTDEDIDTYAGETSKVRLYKPHGCVDMQLSPDHRMVLTSQDYAHSEQIRKKIYTTIQSLAKMGNTVFVGYSLGDYTFRNMYYRLYLDLKEWTHDSYAVTPVGNPLVYKWRANALKELNTNLVDSTFDAFMLRLVKVRGWLPEEVKSLINKHWRTVLKNNGKHMAGLKLAEFLAMPNQPPKRLRAAVGTRKS